tara:strand:- start:1212 stop:1574 length:363 start_codon:yes stop_codon:yes gene_type:complete
MRQPTPLKIQLEWWQRSLKGEQMPIHEGEPHVGYYKARAWSRGPYIPARIWLEQEIDFETGLLADDETYRAEIGEKPWNAMEAWIWIAQKPVSLREYQTLKKALPLIKMDGTRAPTYSHV